VDERRSPVDRRCLLESKLLVARALKLKLRERRRALFATVEIMLLTELDLA
jgi:hypothetical protein